MTVSAPLLTRRAVLQIAMEATYRDEATVGANDAIYVEDPDYSVDVNVLERNFTRDDLSPLPIVIGRRMGSMKFTTELKGSGFNTIAPLLSRLFRASGYSLTSIADSDSSAVYPLGNHPKDVTWAIDATGATHTNVASYVLEVTTPGVSGVAAITITSDVAGQGSASAAVTSGTAINLGTSGLEITPTWTGSLSAGQRWIIWALPVGFRLDPVSDDFESITMVLNIDGVQHKMLGGFGTFNVNAEAGAYAKIEWTFMGTYADPTDVALPICNYEKSIPAQVELARLRLDSDYIIVNAFTFTQGNDIQVRPDVSSAEGYVGQRIVTRAPEGGIDPEAELVANHDFWGRMGRAEQMPFQMRCGTQVGNTVWFIAPSTQYSGLTYQDRNGIRTYDAQLRFSRVTGNDEMLIVFT